MPENFEDLVNFRVAGEQWLARAHLSEDTPNRPHVHARRVLAATKQNLGSAVPQSDNLGYVSSSLS